MRPDPIAVRPCGACSSLVPSDTGCRHWRPGAVISAATLRSQRKRDREELAAARRRLAGQGPA